MSEQSDRECQQQKRPKSRNAIWKETQEEKEKAWKGMKKSLGLMELHCPYDRSLGKAKRGRETWPGGWSAGWASVSTGLDPKHPWQLVLVIPSDRRKRKEDPGCREGFLARQSSQLVSSLRSEVESNGARHLTSLASTCTFTDICTYAHICIQHRETSWILPKSR